MIKKLMKMSRTELLGVLRAFVIALVLYFALFMLVSAGITPQRYDIQVGLPAPVQLKATKDVEDVVTTEEMRDEAADAVETPCLSFGDEGFVHLRDRPPGGATSRKLHYENRDAEKRKTGEIGEDEKPAARLAGDIREAPYISKSYRASGGKEYKAETACELFPHFSSRLADSLSSEGARPSALRAFSIALR